MFLRIRWVHGSPTAPQFQDFELAYVPKFSLQPFPEFTPTDLIAWRGLEASEWPRLDMVEQIQHRSLGKKVFPAVNRDESAVFLSPRPPARSDNECRLFITQYP